MTYLSPYTEGPVAWVGFFPGEVKAVGHVTEIKEDRGYVLLRTIRGQDRRVEVGDVLPLEVVLQRVGSWTWLEEAREDLKAMDKQP